MIDKKIRDEVQAEIDKLVKPTPKGGATWEETDRGTPAPAELVERVLPGHEGVVCLGTLEQIINLGKAQWDSDEGVWGEDGVLTSTNRDVMGPGAPAINRPEKG